MIDFVFLFQRITRDEDSRFGVFVLSISRVFATSFIRSLHNGSDHERGTWVELCLDDKSVCFLVVGADS